MGKLQDSEVLRAGVTASYWKSETRRIRADIDKTGSALELSFKIASKGGGDTAILVKVGESDIRQLLRDLAGMLPQLADALAESTHIAVSQLIQTSKKTSNGNDA